MKTPKALKVIEVMVSKENFKIKIYFLISTPKSLCIYDTV